MNNNDAETAARECYLFIDQAQFIVCFHCCMRRKSGKEVFTRDKITANKKCFDGICGGMLGNVGEIQ
jgi:hypothetical protein